MACWYGDRCDVVVDGGGGGARGGAIEAGTCCNDVVRNCMDPLTSAGITKMTALVPAVKMQRRPRCPFDGPGRDGPDRARNGSSGTRESVAESGCVSSSWNLNNGLEAASCGRRAEAKTASDLSRNAPSTLTAAPRL